jgi:hypothetical protein
MDFCRVNWPIFGGDEDPAELGDLVGGGGLGLGAVPVPGSASAVLGDLGGVPCGGIPDGRCALAVRVNGGCVVHGCGDPVTGLSGTEDLLGVSIRLDHSEGPWFTDWHRHVTLATAAQAFCTMLRTDPRAPSAGMTLYQVQYELQIVPALVLGACLLCCQPTPSTGFAAALPGT